MLPELDQVCIRIYAALVRAPHSSAEDVGASTGFPPAVVGEHLADLAQLRLVVHSVGRWSAADPRVAAHELLDPVEERLRAEHRAAGTALRRVAELRQAFMELDPLHREGRRIASRTGGVEVLIGRDAAGAAMLASALEAAEEMAVMHPPADPGGRVLDQEAAQRDLAVAERGLRLRGLYAHTALPDLELRSHVDRLARLGGEVRTMAAPFAHMVVFDDRVAYLVHQAGDEDGPDGTCTIVTRDPTVVRYLKDLFETAWRDGTPVQADERGYGEALDEVHRMVAELLAEGLKDETAARQMGVSVRSFRRHVAALNSGLGAESRFQAGVAAARSGLLP